MEWKCKHCGSTLPLKNKYTKSGHLAKCSSFKKWKSENITRDVLYQLYVIDGRSLPEIKNLFQLESVSVIAKSMAKFGIELRSISQAALMPRKKERLAETCIIRYGAPHTFCKESTARKEWERKLLENEGITNVFQRNEVKQKSIKTYIEKYGVENAARLPRDGRSNYSKLHRQVVEWISGSGFTPFIEKKIINGDSYLSYDIHISGTNKLIEVNGDFWHANPSKYKPTDIVKISSNQAKTASEIWEKDLFKIKHAEKTGYSVFVIWEEDIKKDELKVENILLEWIKK